MSILPFQSTMGFGMQALEYDMSKTEACYIQANVHLTATIKQFFFFLGMQLAEKGLSSSGRQHHRPGSSRIR